MSASARRKIVEQHQTIEQLTVRVRELEEELERKMSAGQYVLEQLAASQAYAEQLRGVLTECQGFFDPEEGTSHNFRKLTIRDIEKAIALPRDTSALDAYVAEKVKESHKVVPREGLVPHAYQLEATHNNAEYWYKWGHSKEAAEKGESVICMAQAVFAWRNAAYAKAEEVESLTRQRDLAVEALEDVKGCFDAAEFEGLSDRIREANVECGSLADLVMRRLSPALSTIEHALSAIKSEAIAFRHGGV